MKHDNCPYLFIRMYHDQISQFQTFHIAKVELP
jgi:hypothetical protein